MSKNLEILHDFKIGYEENLTEKEELRSKLEELETNLELYKEQVAKLKSQFKDKDKALHELKRTNEEIVRFLSNYPCISQRFLFL